MPESGMPTHRGQGPAPEWQRVHSSSLPFQATIDRLKGGIQAEGLWLLHELDPQALLRREGFTMGPARQLFFFHPRYMARLLEGDPAAILVAPI